MSEAICIYGHIRTWMKTKESFMKYVRNINPKADIFVHTYVQHSNTAKDSLEKYGLDVVRDMMNGLDAVSLTVEDMDDLHLEEEASKYYRHSDDHNKVNNHYSQFRKIYTCHQALLEYERKHELKYTKILYTRFDITYYEPVDLSEVSVDDNWYLGCSGTPDPDDTVVAGGRWAIDLFVSRRTILDELDKWKFRGEDGLDWIHPHILLWLIAANHNFAWKWNCKWKTCLTR